MNSLAHIVMSRRLSKNINFTKNGVTLEEPFMEKVVNVSLLGYAHAQILTFAKGSLAAGRYGLLPHIEFFPYIPQTSGKILCVDRFCLSVISLILQ